MAGTSTSALASLLVAATSCGDNDAAETGNRQTHTNLRECARSSAERKARALSKHRPALVRWTAAATSGAPRRRRQQQQQQQQQQQESTTRGSCASSTTARSDDPPPTIVAVDRTKEARIQSDLVSPLLSLVCTESLGRHIVARTGALPAGTLLLKETPFAWSLHPEFNGEFCAHCLCEMAGSTVLCPGCELVAYCSATCATAALRTWHGSECLDPSSGAPLEPAMSGVSPACRVALRAFHRGRQQEGPPPKKEERRDEELGKAPTTCTATAASAATAAAAIAEARSTTCTAGSSSVASPTSGDGCDVAWPAVKMGHLQEHYIARSARERGLLETEAAVAAVLARGGSGGGGGVGGSGSGGNAGLQADSDGSSGNGGGAKSAGQEGCSLLAAELVTTLFKVSTNAFAVSSLRCSEPSVGRHVRPLTHTKVAVALYLAAAMFNHSCAPNALATFHGGEMRVVATRAIEKGEPVTISYGPLVSKVPSTSERQAYLRNAYFFRCECAACCPSAATGTTITPSRHPGGDEDGNEQELDLVQDRARAAAVASSKRTEFACIAVESGCCPGTLLVGVPPPSSPPPPTPTQEEGAGARSPTSSTPPLAAMVVVSDTVAPPSSSSSSSASRRRTTEVELWCDSCGRRVPPGSADALLGEDEKDRRLWDEAMAVVSRLEEGEQEADGGGGRSSSSRPHPPPPPPRSSRTPVKPAVSSSTHTPEDGSAPVIGSATMASSLALDLVVERVKWRDARLSPLSMRRAVAHDMHARILATREDFAGAADACARAVHVLVKRFAPEDQELGVELLKLAELCFNAGWTDRCSAACRKARVSLGVCLQPGDEQLVTLDTLQALCAAACPRGRV